jgi:hypothetical protein
MLSFISAEHDAQLWIITVRYSPFPNLWGNIFVNAVQVSRAIFMAIRRIQHNASEPNLRRRRRSKDALPTTTTDPDALQAPMEGMEICQKIPIYRLPMHALPSVPQVQELPPHALPAVLQVQALPPHASVPHVQALAMHAFPAVTQVQEMPMHAFPAVPQVQEMPMHALPAVTQVHELPMPVLVCDDLPWT